MTSIVGILRFSVLSTASNPFKLGKELSFEEYARIILDEQRLHRRFTLLNAICLPSFAAQSDNDFKILIVAPRLLPESSQARLNDIVEMHQFLQVAYVHEDEFRMSDISPIVINDMISSKDAFITFRIDDDDAVADTLISRLRPFVNPTFNDYCVSFCRGFYVDIGDDAEAIGVQSKVIPNLAVGLSYVSTRAQPQTIFDISDLHHRMHKMRPVIVDARQNAFITTTHGGNDTGAGRVLPVRDQSPKAAQKKLASRGFHVDLQGLASQLKQQPA